MEFDGTEYNIYGTTVDLTSASTIWEQEYLGSWWMMDKQEPSKRFNWSEIDELFKKEL